MTHEMIVPVEIQNQIGLEPRMERAEIHPGLADLYFLFKREKFISGFMGAGNGNMGERVDLFNKLSEEVEANQDNPTLAQALNVWADCRDTYGLISGKKEKHNSGVLHVFGYQSIPKKSDRFPIQSIQDFIDVSQNALEIISHPDEADLSARIPDRYGHERNFYLKDGNLYIAFKKAKDDEQKLITIIPTKDDGEEFFYKTVRNELDRNKKKRRTNQLDSEPPVFSISGIQSRKEDFLKPLPFVNEGPVTREELENTRVIYKAKDPIREK